MPIPTIREGVITLLSGNNAITALVPASAIYWERLPDDAPVRCILVSQISGTPDVSLSGYTGLVNSRLQIDIFAALGDQEVIEGVREALLDLPLGYQSITVDGNTFQLISLVAFDYGRFIPEPATQVLRYSIDFDLQFGRK